MPAISQTIKLEDRVSDTLKKIEQNAEKVVRQYQEMANAQDRVYKQMEDMERLGNDHSALYKKLAKDYQTYDMALINLSKNGSSKYADSLDRARELQDKLTNSVKGSSTAMTALHSIARKVATVFGISKLINMSDTMTQTEARLGLALSTNNWGGNATQFSDMIYRASQNSRSDYNTMAATISKLGMQAGGAFRGPQELTKFAENLSKVFTISGLDASGMQSVMYNLTQSMSTGHLLGNDYRILKMNAPELINMLKSQYAGGNQGTLDQMVSKGQITSQMLKDAIINSTDEIQAKFEEMPVTWQQVWTRIKNMTQKLLKPVLKLISRLADAAEDALTWIEEHWEQLQPLLVTGIAAITIAFAGLLVQKVLNTLATRAETLATIAQTKAFLASATAAKLKATAEGQAAIASLEHAAAMNTASMAVLGFIAKLAIFAAVIIGVAYLFAWVGEKITGEAISALGLIAGSVLVILGTIYNIIVGVLDAILTVINAIIEPIAYVVEFIQNIWSDGFDNIGAKAANLIGNLIAWFLNLGKVVTTIVDAIFGTNWTGGLQSLQNSLRSWGANDKAKVTTDRNYIKNPLSRAKIYDQNEGLFYKGYNWGKGVQEGLGNAFKGTEDILDKVIVNGENGEPAVNTTGSVKIDEEDIQLLLDLATRDFNIEYQQLTPQITMTFTGDITQNADMDGIIENVYEQLREEFNGDCEVVMG